MNFSNLLITDPSKNGTALLIKFGVNSDNKKTRFLNLTRGIKFHPFYKQKYYKLSPDSIIKNISKKSLKTTLKAKNYMFLM
jgi:hypothetical protein